MKRVFISYGRDYLSFFPLQVAHDLEKNQSFRVHLDKRMEPAVEFDSWIQEKLDDTDVVLFFMSKHSTRRPDSVCLDEIAYARSNSIQIIPVLIEECSPPFLVSRLNWLDARDAIDVTNRSINEARYKIKFDLILATIENGLLDENANGVAIDLKKKLMPFDFSLILANQSGFFTERKAFSEYYNRWISSSDTVLWISAHTGSGKSFLSSHLANEDIRIKGIHFCKNFSSDTGIAKRVLMHLAFNLYTQDERYGKTLEENVDFSSFDKVGLSKVFYDLFIKCITPLDLKEPYVLIIDGVDEAPADEIAELGNAIFQNLDRIPKNLKFILTSRPEMSVLQSLSFLKKYELLNDKDDMKSYVCDLCEKKGLEICEKDVEQIVELSQGNYLYVRTLFDLNEGNVLDLNALKSGMSSIFSSSFARFFKDEDFNDLPRKLLQILVALKDSVQISTISEILNIDEYELHNLLKKFGTLLQNDNNRVMLYHKSLGDWLTNQKNIKYFVSAKEGDKVICQWIKNNLFNFMFNQYISKYGFDHLFNAGEYDTIFSVLDMFGEELDDSLCLMLVHNSIPSKYSNIAKFIYIGFKDHPNVFPLRKIIRFFVEYGCYSSMKRFFEQFVSQNASFSWVIPYSDLIDNRMKVRIEEAYNTPDTFFENAPVDVLADYYYYRAEASRELGKYNEAMDLYRMASKTCSSASRFSYYMSMIKMADILFVFGDYQNALSTANGITLNENNLEGTFAKERVLGHIYKSLRCTNEAKIHYTKSLEIAKEMGKMYAIVESYNSLATVLSTTEAIQYLEKTISLATANNYKLELGKAYCELGVIYYSQGRIKDAHQSAIKALKNQNEVKYLGGICSARRLLVDCLIEEKEYQEGLSNARDNILDMLSSKVDSSKTIIDIKQYQLCKNGLGVFDTFVNNSSISLESISKSDTYFWSELEKNNIANDVLKKACESKSKDFKIGYHNQNHVIEIKGEKYILRIPVVDFDVVDIRIFNENDVLTFLNEKKIGIHHPSFIDYGIFDGQKVSIHSFVDGNQMREVVSDDLNVPNEFVTKFAGIMSKIHYLKEAPFVKETKYCDTKSFYLYDYNFISSLVKKWFNRYKDLYIGLGFPEDIDTLLQFRGEELFENGFSLTHCDMHRGNVIITKSGDFSVLDWELTQFTDPLYDVAIHLHKMFYSEEQEDLFLKNYFKSFNYNYNQALKQISVYRNLEEVKSCVIDIIRLINEIDLFDENKLKKMCGKYLLKIKALEKNQKFYHVPFSNQDELYDFIINHGKKIIH